MNDRVVGIFEDRAAAEKALSDLLASGMEQDRVTVKRVLKPGHRGFSDSDTVHSLIHAPEIREGDTASPDAGTVILIVEMVERPDPSQPDTGSGGETEGSGPADEPSRREPDTGGFDSYDIAAVMGALEQLGATDTRVVEATPPLDL